jgi:pyruvate dehydrogenase E2 component (dihydrolipoamide acetyltransferase)
VAEVIMPKMGDAMTEGKLLTWKKRPGDPVAKGETIAEIETDKVNVEIEAEEAGVLLETLIGEGQSAPIGAAIALIGAPGEKVPPRPAATRTPAVSAPGPIPATPRALTSTPATPADAERVKASPLARKLAAEHAIDLASVKGTGPDGRITKEDVEVLIAAEARPKPAASPVAGPTGPRGGEFESVPLSRIRQTIGRRLSESKQQAPHFYVTVEVDMDAALRARQQLNETLEDQKRVSVNDFALKATALALRKFPNLNSALVEGAIRRYRRINMALAVALPEGLIAPVIHDCDRLTLAQIATAAKGLGERARSGKLRAEDMDGGTFTVTNLGMFGDIDSFIAIINPPQTGIVAVGKTMARAVVRDGHIVPATTMKLTLSADHRVTDGAEGAQYLQEVKRLLESPLLLVLDQP